MRHQHTDADSAGGHAAAPSRDGLQTVVLEVTGLNWATSKNVAEATLGRRPGVVTVDANPVAQTATVAYDPTLTDVAELSDWVRDCGYHCAGQSVPHHVCDPMTEPRPATGHDGHLTHDPHAGHSIAPASPVSSPHDAMGHGGHGSMSMADMVRDMRNRFLVAALLSIPILLWSPIGREVLGFDTAAPFGCQ